MYRSQTAACYPFCLFLAVLGKVNSCHRILHLQIIRFMSGVVGKRVNMCKHISTMRYSTAFIMSQMLVPLSEQITEIVFKFCNQQTVMSFFIMFLNMCCCQKRYDSCAMLLLLVRNCKNKKFFDFVFM